VGQAKGSLGLAGRAALKGLSTATGSRDRGGRDRSDMAVPGCSSATVTHGAVPGHGMTRLVTAS
jgi:hypothetical protein